MKRTVNKLPNKGALFTRRYFILLIVCIVTGFIIGFSYNLSKDKRESGTIHSSEYQQENAYREQLLTQQERNKQLSDELAQLEQKVFEYEKSFSTDQKAYETLLNEANALRLTLGYIPAVGEGVTIQLEDGDYDPLATNPNDYIIHESHLFKIINELKIAGAEGIAINGKRLTDTSYIVCNGPVITIDGVQYPAPFVIEAIGNKDTLMQALELTGGVIDQLVNDKIDVTTEKNDKVELAAVNNEL